MRPKTPTSIDEAVRLIAKYEAENQELHAKKLARPEGANAKQWHASLEGHIRMRNAELIRLRAWVVVARRKERPDRYIARNKELRQALEDAYRMLVRIASVTQLSPREQDQLFRIKQVLDAHATYAAENATSYVATTEPS